MITHNSVLSFSRVVVFSFVLLVLANLAGACGGSSNGNNTNGNASENPTGNEGANADQLGCTVEQTSDGAVITCDDGTTATIANGADGFNGDDGSDGADGQDGSDGIDGTDGADGAPGSDGANGTPGNDGAQGAQGQNGNDGADGESCFLYPAVDGYVLSCVNDAVYVDVVNGTATDLFSATLTATEITMTAAKRNGGEGGSKWFDAALNLDTPVDLNLADDANIVTGDGGNGQKLYILFNDTIDCAYFSNSVSQTYENRYCVIGGTRNPSVPDGFDFGAQYTGGTIDDVTSIEMTVAGSDGDGVVTIVEVVFDLL